MNIIVLIIDTLRYDHIGANGNTTVKTPNLDRFAERSLNCHRAFASSFPTIPHRTDVITGRYGAPFHPWKCLACDVPALPRILAGEGYCSQLIHDTPHLVNGATAFDVPFDAWMQIRGGEVDRSWISDSWDPLPNWRLDPALDSMGMNMEEAIRKHHALTPYVQTNRHRSRPEDWNAAQLFLTASRFLRDNRTRDDFFLWIDCFDPHEPWDSPPEFVRQYDGTPGSDGTIDPRLFHVGKSARISAEVRERLKGLYRAKVAHLDKWVGDFLDTLEETGLARNTAVILTADHGTNIGDRGELQFGKKGPPAENEAHVPFMVSAPGLDPADTDMLVQPQDVFATVLALADADCGLPDGVESFDVCERGSKGQPVRRLALSGGSARGWGRAREGVLFSVFTREWRLGFAAKPENCELQRLGTHENVAGENSGVVEELHRLGRVEIQRRGLDPALGAWLEAEGNIHFPEECRFTDAPPAPDGWKGSYWQNINRTLGVRK